MAPTQVRHAMQQTMQYSAAMLKGGPARMHPTAVVEVSFMCSAAQLVLLYSALLQVHVN